MVQPAEEIDQLKQHLMQRWLAWGIAPLIVCAVLAGLLLVLWSHPGPIEGKQETRLAFEIVLGVGAAIFLAGFYIDGHWTSADRLARRIFEASGGETADVPPEDWAKYGSNRSQLRSNAEIALNSIRASADAITLMGGAIGLVAIVSVIMGLPGIHVLQILLLQLFYQLFVFSRHPYYLRLAEAALNAELLPSSERKQKSA